MKISLQEKYEWDGKSENVKTFRWILTVIQRQKKVTRPHLFSANFQFCVVLILTAWLS